ncbi:MAG: amidotransferase 1, exosortase A system-associated [Magnetospirillum sp.]|nr:amidotransferase 1, exosortase A system-associated [Magnetospirillum sp.]
MCGIVGLFDSRGRRPLDGALLQRMNETQVHRGPDGGGLHLAPGIGLGHRRLAIIDPAGGHQPLFNEDGRVAVVFNGEIYNFRPLVAELEAAGHVFATRSDTEVIVHAWEQWGADCVARFAGMFAFALWDEGRETLFLARDRLGKKPLYTALLGDGVLVFGSELKAVTAHPAVSRDLDPQAVADFFAYGYVPDPRSIHAGVRKLPPAHRLVWRRGEAMRLERYWRLAAASPDLHRLDDAAEDLEHRLREATRHRLIADVPLGAFLSGGVDSSAVVATMAALAAEPVKTFSIGFAEASHDESDYARRVAARWGTDHHCRGVSPDDFALLDRLATIYDEPFGDSSAMPTFRVCALARERVTVALSGDGGDELFAGYRRYAFHAAVERGRRLLPDSWRRPLFGTLGRVYPKLDWAPRWLRAKTSFAELAADTAAGYFAVVAVTGETMRQRLFAPALHRALAGYDPCQAVRTAMAQCDSDDPLLQVQAADLATWLPGGILVKVDRASMANSLEVRAPLLDHTLLEWSTRLAPRLKLDGLAGKRVLKRAMERHVDADILYRPKRGFSMPLARWFRGPLAGRLAAMAEGPVLAGSGLFEPAAIRELVDRHRSGRSDHSAVLWLLLMFEAFLRR